MKTSNYFSGRSVLSLMAASMLIPVTTLSQNVPAASQPASFVYNYPLNKQVKYKVTTKILQVMDINGQSMENNINNYVGMTLKSLGASGSDYKIEVKIDTMAQNVDSPGGSNGGPIPSVAGKTYNIIISPDGKVTDNSEAKNVTYDAGGTTSDAVQLTDGFFPVLPLQAIKPGYTWTSSDSANSRGTSMVMLATVLSENTFVGYELFNGVNCAKITSALSGTRIMKTQTQGMDIKISGPYTGSITSYFAPSTGYFIRQEVSTKMNGTIDITSPDAMSFPIVMETTTVKEEVK
jgi:hypothetical protein